MVDEVVGDTRQDAAAKVHAAARAQGQDEVGGDGGEESAEVVKRCPRPRFARQRGGSDFGGRAVADVVFRVGERAVDKREAGAVDEALGGDVAVLDARVLPDGKFGVVARREADMPAFAGQRYPAVAVRNEAGYTETRAGAKHGDGRARDRFSRAHSAFFGGRQARDGKRLRGEIVDNAQFFQPQFVLHGGDGETPMVVGHLDVVAGDGVGDGNRRLRDRLTLRLQIGTDGVLQRGVVGGGQGLDGEQARTVAQGEAGVGAANIGEQVQAWHGYLRVVEFCVKIPSFPLYLCV